MLDPLFFLIARLNIMLVLLMLLVSRLINRSGLRISYSKVFSSAQIVLKTKLGRERGKGGVNIKYILIYIPLIKTARFGR